MEASRTETRWTEKGSGRKLVERKRRRRKSNIISMQEKVCIQKDYAFANYSVLVRALLQHFIALLCCLLSIMF